MKKATLLERAERWKENSRKHPLFGYPRANQTEIIEISVAIIKALCELEGVTPYRAKEAMKIAADIIDAESANETIS